jgi:hypothetical protein
MVKLSLSAIILSGIAGTFIGYVWYGLIFSKTWKRLAELPEKTGARQAIISLIALFLANTIIAYVMTYFGIAWNIYTWIGALQLGIWIWIGFMAPILLAQAAGERRSFKLYAIHAGYWLVTSIATAFILMQIALYITAYNLAHSEYFPDPQEGTQQYDEVE